MTYDQVLLMNEDLFITILNTFTEYYVGTLFEYEYISIYVKIFQRIALRVDKDSPKYIQILQIHISNGKINVTNTKMSIFIFFDFDVETYWLRQSIVIEIFWLNWHILMFASFSEYFLFFNSHIKLHKAHFSPQLFFFHYRMHLKILILIPFVHKLIHTHSHTCTI